jgi:hypothetical protein
MERKDFEQFEGLREVEELISNIRETEELRLSKKMVSSMAVSITKLLITVYLTKLEKGEKEYVAARKEDFIIWVYGEAVLQNINNSNNLRDNRIMVAENASIATEVGTCGNSKESEYDSTKREMAKSHDVVQRLVNCSERTYSGGKNRTSSGVEEDNCTKRNGVQKNGKQGTKVKENTELYYNKRKRNAEEPCRRYCTDVTMRWNETRVFDGSNSCWKDMFEDGSLVLNHQPRSIGSGNDDNAVHQDISVMVKEVGRGRTGAMQMTSKEGNTEDENRKQIMEEFLAFQETRKGEYLSKDNNVVSHENEGETGVIESIPLSDGKVDAGAVQCGAEEEYGRCQKVNCRRQQVSWQEGTSNVPSVGRWNQKMQMQCIPTETGCVDQRFEVNEESIGKSIKIMEVTEEDKINYVVSNMVKLYEMSSAVGYTKLEYPDVITNAEEENGLCSDDDLYASNASCCICDKPFAVGERASLNSNCGNINSEKHYLCEVCTYRYCVNVPQRTDYLKEKIIAYSPKRCPNCRKEGVFKKLHMHRESSRKRGTRWKCNEDVRSWGRGFLIEGTHQRTGYCNWILDRKLMVAIQLSETTKKEADYVENRERTMEEKLLYYKYMDMAHLKFNCYVCARKFPNIECCMARSCTLSCAYKLCRGCFAGVVLSSEWTSSSSSYLKGKIRCPFCTLADYAWNPYAEKLWCRETG